MKYKDFISQKRMRGIDKGFECIYMPDFLFDFQRFIVEKAIRKGRCAIFADTGLGKTAMELTLAMNIVKKYNKRVLILAPLAVSFQFLVEAEKIGIDDIEVSKKGKFEKKIVVTNYERLKYFNPNDFECLILDESSILKNFDGAIKNEINIFIRNIKYRFLCTATPSPNDFIELGTSSEALGELGYMDMLGKFFSNNENNIRPQNIGCKWYLKPHAQDDFFEWVSSWSISIRKPSDLGFSDDRYKLPKLIKKYTEVKNDSNWVRNDQLFMFNQPAHSMTEVRDENRNTIQERCEKAYEISKPNDISVYWCHYNKEGDILDELDNDAVQIKGGMNIDKKEDILISFAKGEIKKLITKPKMTAFGLNWQHCNHTVYFPTWSYEQYYQAIRRFWRFGQTREVTVDMIYSDGQKRVIDILETKTQKAIELFDKLNTTLNEHALKVENNFKNKVQKPSFL